MNYPHVHIRANKRIKESHTYGDHDNEVHIPRKVVPNALLIIMNLNPQKNGIDRYNDDFKNDQPNRKQFLILITRLLDHSFFYIYFL